METCDALDDLIPRGRLRPPKGLFDNRIVRFVRAIAGNVCPPSRVDGRPGVRCHAAHPQQNRPKHIRGGLERWRPAMGFDRADKARSYLEPGIHPRRRKTIALRSKTCPRVAHEFFRCDPRYPPLQPSSRKRGIETWSVRRKSKPPRQCRYLDSKQTLGRRDNEPPGQGARQVNCASAGSTSRPCRSAKRWSIR